MQARRVALLVPWCCRSTSTKRGASSSQWLQRQHRDPYVTEAKRSGFRSRAAFKLLQIDQKTRLLRKARCVVDLGAAPGGWTQAVLSRVPNCNIIAIDVLPIEPIPGATIIRGDFTAEPTREAVKGLLTRGSVDVVLSDMAPSFSGHHDVDHARQMALCGAAVRFARAFLRPGGHLLLKVLQGSELPQLRTSVGQAFTKVHMIKPDASRSQSSETFLYCAGYRPDAAMGGD